MQIAALMGIVYKDLRGISSFLFILCLCGVSCTVFVWLRYIGRFVSSDNEDKDTKSVVRVWTHNGATRVIPENLWQIQSQLHRLECLAGIAPRDQRLDPNISIVFSNDPAKADWVTGDMQECSKLLAGCVVEKTDMYVPVYRRHAVTPTGAWKLVHGPDSEPPKVTS